MGTPQNPFMTLLEQKIQEAQDELVRETTCPFDGFFYIQEGWGCPFCGLTKGQYGPPPPPKDFLGLAGLLG